MQLPLWVMRGRGLTLMQAWFIKFCTGSCLLCNLFIRLLANGKVWCSQMATWQNVALSGYLLCIIALVVPDPILALFWGWPTKDLLLCLSLSQLQDHPQRGNTLSPVVTPSCHMSAQMSSQTLCTPPVSGGCVCLFAPLVCHTTIPTFPQSWCGDTVFNQGGTILRTCSSGVCEFSSILTLHTWRQNQISR